MEQIIKEMLPKEKGLNEGPLRAQCENRDSYSGYNQALSEVHALIPQIIEKVYAELEGEIENLIQDEFNEMPASNKQMHYVRAYQNVLSLLSTKK